MSNKSKRPGKKPPFSGPRPIHSNRLLMDLILSGRRVVCEVKGCGCMDKQLLELHHVVPVSIRPMHTPQNLVILCKDHHALVERFYWQERSLLMPEACKEIRRIARCFQARALKPGEIPEYQGRTKALWRELNAHEKCQNPLWWQSVYARAKSWAARQEVLRPVQAGDAITEDPWFRNAEGVVEREKEEAYG